ncbi:hypothetical protein HanIR_Chr10g0465651 [Helianthus annuus]|nr:hypothetical protein HanIR_Chr10g0465651 [Helianthus annuus]
MTKDMFVERYPFHHGNCNCEPCIPNVHPWINKKNDLGPNVDERVQGSKIILICKGDEDRC